MQRRTEDRYALVGAGPSGLAAARALQRHGIAFDGFESHSDVGGLWDIGNPRSTVYRSAHLISSKTTTQFDEFPMAGDVADYPSHVALREYFRDYADAFGLREDFRFGTSVERARRVAGGWDVTTRSDAGERTARYRGVVAANGTLATPHRPGFPGEFAGRVMHTAEYRDPEIFRGKRVLVVGAGNSGCDIAVDAVHHADAVDISVRRGYWFVPKYLFGRPSDTLNQGKPMPPWIKQRVDALLLRQFTGDPVRFGFPKPDHRIYESHPIVNSLILHHLGHGDIRVRGDIDRFDGDHVAFAGGERAAYDIVVLATGYRLDYPFLDPADLGWSGDAPELFLNIASRVHDSLFVLGMVEASGLGWQGRAEQAELVARVLAARKNDPEAAARWEAAVHGPPPDLSGGYRYLRLRRMAYYVNKDAYRSAVRDWSERLAGDAVLPVPDGART
ncbi:NAD(P)/FAD-dependent oxidoreductase [Rhodococcus rhodnii]|uniref:Dimethylaniline monooxygenase n=2 Tax=Rhodococcus rhodnii TaxID=38312 RepID=R7WTD1_9NOCA|nr:NAD(P)-binding domain-containing protein [Rhodococcus rhodnii]EOM78498.1 dimethylaniline monooxygenase [Rhodococcus rhodnii LMG 5362]TXG91294.1 NAD(P)/FAD-dependent oxidoreductase [Rhodococcus rhodnii]